MSSDRSALAAIIPTAAPLPSKGWSALASIQHNWTEKWVSNVFASRVELDLDHELGKQSVSMDRLGVNLIHKIADKLQIGAEVAYVDIRIEDNGILGIFNGSSLKGTSVFGWIKKEF